MSGDSTVIEGEIVPERALEAWTPKFIEPIGTMKARREANLEYMREVLRPGIHYGVIPGTNSKPSLLKPGAQALCRDVGLHPEPIVLEHISDVMGKDHGGEVFFSYNVRVDLYSIKFEPRRWVGAGIGSCNSWEERYRWRTATRKCPQCGKEAIIKGKAEYGGGWLCWRKKDGCGATFPENAVAITSQEAGRVPNDRVMDLDNTIFKQAAKRALVEAVLNVTGASDVFTQDMDNSDEIDDEDRGREEAVRPAPAPAPVPRRTPPPAAPEPIGPAPEAAKKSGYIDTSPTNDRELRSDVIRMWNAHPKEAVAFIKERSYPAGVASMDREQVLELGEYLSGLPA